MRIHKLAALAVFGIVAVSAAAQQQEQAGSQTIEQVLAELKRTNERMASLEQEIAKLKSQAEKQKENPPANAKDLADLKKTKVSGYVQTQYRDSDLDGQSDGFRMRRARMSISHTFDPKAKLKVSFDLAASQFGSTVNEPTESVAQLRDAILSYKVAESSEAHFGRQPLPLGYEIERSSSDREFPERAMYNQVMFAGERSTGLQVRHGIGKNALFHAGVFNALTVNDLQQRTVQGPVGDELAATAGIRYLKDKLSAGLSGFWGERPSQTEGLITNAEADRHFVYLDASYNGLFDPNIFIRTEWMWGKDRLPASKASAGNEERDMSGNHLLLGYNFNPRNQISFKWESFDRDTDVSGDRLNGWGIAYNHWLNPGARLTAAYERFDDDTLADETYQITTLRVQFKF